MMSKMVQTGDVLVRADGDFAVPYEVIIADDKLFVIGMIKANTDGGQSVDFTALLIIGQIIKNIEAIPDKWIPVILLPIGIAGALLCGGLSVDSAIQGILVTGVAVYGNQLVKQLGNKE